MFNMSHSFVLLGGNDKKLILENATHPCPRCKKHDTVQLTRSETNIIIFNKRIELPNNMRVRYECRMCHWKNDTLPDDDPSFQSIPSFADDDIVQRQDSNGYYSIVSTSSRSIHSNASSTQKLKEQQQVETNRNIYKKRTSLSY